MCAGLRGLQLRFDAAVRQRQIGPDLPEDLRAGGAGGLGVRSRAPRALSALQVIEFDLMKAMPNLGYCLPEDNAGELNSMLGKMPGGFL